MDLASGSKVDRYVLLERLGAGGQGAVYRAEDPLDASRPRALKLVNVLEVRPNDLERVRREARALAKLDHPSLVKCHGLFEDLNHGVLGMSMDFVAGTSARAARKDARWRKQHVGWLLRHLAFALAYLHERGLVHRDIKLENVLVADAFFAAPEMPEHVKLVDFGIAMVPGNVQTLTALGSLIGTLSYLAPEQLDPGAFGPDASGSQLDIFAFGVLGWQLLCGEHPTGLPRHANLVDYAAAYRRAAEATSPWPPSFDAGPWPNLLRECLKVRVAERIQNGQALWERCQKLPPIEEPSEEKQPSPFSERDVSAVRGDAARTIVSHGVDCDVSAPTVLDARAPNVAAPVETSKPETKPERPNSAPLWIALLATGVIALPVGYWLMSSRRSAQLAPVASQTRIPAILPSALPEASTSVTRFVPSTCAEGAELCACCPSGRDCLRVACDARLGFEGWRLRVGAVQLSKEVAEEAQSLHERADARLCVSTRRFKEEACMPFRAPASAENRIYVTTEDLEREGMEIRLQVDSYSPVPIAVGKFGGPTDAGAITELKREVLCSGLQVTMSEGFVDRLTLFLDPSTADTHLPEPCESPAPESAPTPTPVPTAAPAPASSD